MSLARFSVLVFPCFMVTLISVQMGESLAGLWYPVGLLGLAFVIGVFFLPETRNAALDV